MTTSMEAIVEVKEVGKIYDGRVEALKDVRMCLEEAALLGVPMAVGRSVGELLSRTQEEFGAESDCTCVARVVESRAGCEISPKRGSKS